MLKLGQFIIATQLFLLGTPAFAAELLISIPQDEHLDPASTQSMSVRPGDKVSLVAALYDKLDGGGWKDRGHRSNEFDWQPNCDTSSSACPTASATSGSVVITINVPICFPVGSTVFTVTMPSPPEGESAPTAAHVTLTNTEQPSICPGGNSGTRPAVTVSASAIQANPRAQADAPAANAQSARGGGHGYAANSDPRQDPRWQAMAAAAYAREAEAHAYSNGSQRGFNYGDQYSGSALVYSCGYKGNKLRCRHVQSAKKPPARKTKRVVKKQRRR